MPPSHWGVGAACATGLPGHFAQRFGACPWRPVHGAARGGGEGGLPNALTIRSQNGAINWGIPNASLELRSIVSCQLVIPQVERTPSHPHSAPVGAS
jgi:hypothetical protein